MTQPLQILLIDKKPERSATVEAALTSANHKVIALRENTNGLTAAVAQEAPELIVITMAQPDPTTLDNINTLNTYAPRPIILFAEHTGKRDAIQAAMNAGVSVYINGEIPLYRLASIIDTAFARFDNLHALQRELGQARTALLERELVEHAKRLIMQNQGCQEQKAYRLLQKSAMDQSRPLAQVAQRVIDMLSPRARVTAPTAKHSSC